MLFLKFLTLMEKNIFNCADTRETKKKINEARVLITLSPRCKQPTSEVVPPHEVLSSPLLVDAWKGTKKVFSLFESRLRERPWRGGGGRRKECCRQNLRHHPKPDHREWRHFWEEKKKQTKKNDAFFISLSLFFLPGSKEAMAHASVACFFATAFFLCHCRRH